MQELLRKMALREQQTTAKTIQRSHNWHRLPTIAVGQDQHKEPLNLHQKISEGLKSKVIDLSVFPI